MGATHLATLARIPDIQIGAVAARNEALLSGDFSQVGGNLGHPLPNVDLSSVSKYHAWTDLIADSKVDAVDICLPSDLHEPVATAALEAGKHVLCEKPMALGVKECDNMLDAMRRASRVLMVGHVLRFWPAYKYLQEFVAAARYGPVRHVTLTRYCGLPSWSRWLPDESRSGGAILDLLVHDLDQILSLFGTPAAVRAKRLGSADAVTATFLYPNGPEVRLQGGWLAAGTPFSMGFQVRSDEAEVQLASGVLTLLDASGRREVISMEGIDPFAAELAYFQQCCARNQHPDLCPPEQSRAAVQLALLVKKSRELSGEQITCAI